MLCREMVYCISKNLLEYFRSGAVVGFGIAEECVAHDVAAGVAVCVLSLVVWAYMRRTSELPAAGTPLSQISSISSLMELERLLKAAAYIKSTLLASGRSESVPPQDDRSTAAQMAAAMPCKNRFIKQR